MMGFKIFVGSLPRWSQFLLVGTQECSPSQTHDIRETLGACHVVHLQPQAQGSLWSLLIQFLSKHR